MEVARFQRSSKSGTMRTSKMNENANQVDGFVSQTYPIGQFLGLTAVQFAADVFLSAGNIPDDPTATLYYHIFLRAVDDDISSVTRSLVRVQLILDTEFWNATEAFAPVNIVTGPAPLLLSHLPPPPLIDHEMKASDVSTISRDAMREA